MGRRAVFSIIALIVVFMASCRGYRVAESCTTSSVKYDSVLVIEDSVVIKDSVDVRHVLGRLTVDSIELPGGKVGFLVRTDTITYYVNQSIQTKSKQAASTSNNKDSVSKVAVDKTTPRWKLITEGLGIMLLTLAICCVVYRFKR